MSGTAARTDLPHPSVGQLCWTVFFVSAGVLGFEIACMRVLRIASFHHFAFLVISLALLGFGASGSVLVLLRHRVLSRAAFLLLCLTLGTAASMPTAFGLAQHVPIDAADLVSTPVRQILCWSLYWSLLAVPFFLGACAIVLALMAAGPAVPTVYGWNLLGSAVGTIVATAAMHKIDPAWLAVVMGLVACPGGLALSIPLRSRSRLWHLTSRRSLWAPWAACVATTAVYVLADLPHIRIDRYKTGAYVRQLAAQGQARRVAVRFGPRAMVEAYRADVFHDLPFLSGNLAPPRIALLLADGQTAGPVLEAASSAEAAVVEQLLTAFPYAFIPPGADVLLLGESGGVNIWQAERHGARSIHVVQPDANILSVLNDELRTYGGAVMTLPAVEAHVTDPRDFVERTPERFDLIQLVAAEGTTAGSHGMGGLSEDLLLTVEGLAAAWKRLQPQGVLTVTRGIQTPPRDNLKLLATLIASLRRSGVARPDRHIVIVRDFLGVCTMAKATPWTDEQIEKVRRTCARRGLTPVWFTGIRANELNTPDVLPGPSDHPGDWYHHAAVQLFSHHAEEFLKSWPFEIHPPTDDRPYFLDFFKLGAIPQLKQVFGGLWLTRVELAFPIVLAAIVAIGAAAAVLTFAPLLFLRTAQSASGWPTVLGYFAAIGLAYLLLEMTFLSRLVRWVGDPVSAAAVAIAGFLVFSGIGSLAAGRFVHASHVRLRVVLAALIVAGAIELSFLLLHVAAPAGFSYAARSALSLAFIAPLGFLMGFPMPLALARIQRGNPALIPWAWGINGFASVLAAPLAVALSMTWGYAVVGATALALYLVPVALIGRLPGAAK